jgi:hypothetical protein
MELLAGEAEAITRKALEMALGGDATALRLWLERVAPPRKDAPVQFPLPRMVTAHDAAEVAGAVLEAVSVGDLTTGEGAQIMGLVDSFRRTLEVTELESRTAALEVSAGEKSALEAEIHSTGPSHAT